MFSLPPVTFGAAGTNTKTSVLVLRKNGQACAAGGTFFGEAREVGFDVVTRSGQRRRVRSPRTDLPSLLAEYRGERHPTLGRHRSLPSMVDRWDAAFHIGLPKNIAAVVEDAALLKVSDVATLVDERVDPRQQEARTFDYIEISDVDTRTGLVGHKSIAATEAPSRARKVVRSGDVLVSTVRPERGAVGVTPARLDGAICSTGFAVLRCSGIHPLVLAWLLKTELVRKQMIRNNIGIAYPAISESTCLELVLPAKSADIARLSSAAETLEKAQLRFEAAHGSFLASVNELDCLLSGADGGLRKIPDFIDAPKPSAVSNVA